ncbi:hypothetical protein AB5J72_00555 [Streptomyces sp. CG1]|uniref:hypothetical protein n=1 Tax=Streptomyces sp. CG1 TaxID=1287523 RepID=UPI0034E2E18E
MTSTAAERRGEAGSNCGALGSRWDWVTNNNEPAEGVSLVHQCKLNGSTRTIAYLLISARSGP